MDEITKRAIVVQVFSTIMLALLFTGITYFVYIDMPVEWFERTNELGWTFVQAIVFCSAPAVLITMFYVAQKECSL